MFCSMAHYKEFLDFLITKCPRSSTMGWLLGKTSQKYKRPIEENIEKYKNSLKQFCAKLRHK